MFKDGGIEILHVLGSESLIYISLDLCRFLRDHVYHPRERNVNFYQLELTVAKRGTRKWLLELWRPLLSSMSTTFPIL